MLFSCRSHPEFHFKWNIKKRNEHSISVDNSLMPSTLFLIYWEIPLGNISTIMKIEFEIVYTNIEEGKKTLMVFRCWNLLYVIFFTDFKLTLFCWRSFSWIDYVNLSSNSLAIKWGITATMITSSLTKCCSNAIHHFRQGQV